MAEGKEVLFHPERTDSADLRWQKECHMKASARGFTLIELLVTISIAVILLTIAVPSFNEFLVRNRVSGVTNELMTALNLARSEAVRRGQPVSVCKSSNGTTCATSGEWDSGWIVFVNEDNDSPAVVDTGEAILQVRQNLPQGVTVRPNNNFTNYITFSRTGLANNLGTFAICVGSDESTARAITVIRTRATVATDSDDADTIPEKSSGDGNLENISSCENP
jgi:type IV fimbrial biogenesis protein FimT